LVVRQFLLSFFDDRALLIDFVSDQVDDADRNPRDKKGEKQNHYDS
jgi:hypothetical protein